MNILNGGRLFDVAHAAVQIKYFIIRKKVISMVWLETNREKTSTGVTAFSMDLKDTRGITILYKKYVN